MNNRLPPLTGIVGKGVLNALALGALLLVQGGLHAASLTLSASAPTPGTNDVYNFTGANNDGANVSDGGAYADGAANDAFTYVAGDRADQGQTFTTGGNTNGYVVNAVWVRHVGYTNNTQLTYWQMNSGVTLSARITDPSQAGAAGFAVHSETYTTTGSEGWPSSLSSSANGDGEWVRIAFDSPVALLPNKTYGFDLTSGTTGVFFEWLGTSNNVFSGSAYQGSTSGSPDNTLTTLVGDRVFLVELAAGNSTSTANGVTVTVDPVVALTNYTGLGEWNTNGNFESWTTASVSGATVSGGTLSGTGSAATAQVSRLNLINGPDLDLAFNDILDLRIQVPATFAGDLHVYYGSTFASGISASRMLTIPNASIPKDGAFHIYRLDLGLEVPWRGNLTDLRVELTGASGVAFAVDYLRVGDLTGEVYSPRITSECPAAGGTTPGGATYGANQTVYSMESKHFRFLWNDATTANASWTANMPHGTLRNAEEVWQVHAKLLGYREPCYALETQSGTKYKVNITTWYSGYWEGGDTYNGTTLARFNATPDGLRVDPPTWVLPHELMHAFQLHNTSGYVPGSWWEGHANYGRERWIEHYQALFPNQSGIDPTYLRCAHQLIAEGRDYYLSWPLFLYLDENPDNLPDLGEGTMVKLWQQCQINEYPLMTLERLTPTNNIKDIVGYFARREATFNYKSKTAIQAALAGFGTPLDNAATARWQFTDLVQRSDDTNWWRVPYEMAPMQGAYAIHELVPAGSGDGRVVTVNFHGLPDSGRGADWRASFIVISDTGAERYSTLWGSGTNSVTLAANENKVYLSVAGAPATFYTGSPNNSFAGDYDESVYPYRSWPSKTRFPYELQVTGATPKIRDNGSTSGLVQHSNGGGWKASGVTVPTTVYIGPNARVLGGSVSGNARIEDYAVVSAGTVNGSAVISGHAWVRGGTVTDNAKVRDWALVEGGTISGNARVLEHANIKGGAVTDNATAKGTAASLTGTISGTAIIDGDYGDFFFGRDVTSGVAFGHLPYVGVPDNFIHPLPGGIYAAYDFATAHDSRILDQYGVTDGFLQNSPTWYATDGRRQGFIVFNGVNQFVTLDRSLCDLRQTTIAAWVKWSGGSGNQPIIYFGTSATNCLFITPDDGIGHAKFSMTRAGATQTLAWSSALPVGAWANVAVTLDGTNAAFYVNGALAATTAATNRADMFLAPNTAAGLEQNYLARGVGNSLPFFQGALDDVRIYAAALTAGDIAALAPSAPTGTGTLYVDLRATNSANGAATFATWTNLGVSVGNFTKSGTTTYTNNVANTQVSGVLFNGTSGFYSSANTSLADITGASDRTIEVWAYNPAIASEETMVSLGNRSGTRVDCAFNFGNAAGWGAVTHFNDDVPWGTVPTANAWHHLVYVYDGTTNVQVYADGALNTSDALGGVLVTPATDPINIGCQRNTASGGAATMFYSGYLNTVRIWGGAMTAKQVAADYALGPWIAPNAQNIAFGMISNMNLNVGVALNLTNSASDPNQPPLPLTFSILSAPSGAAIDPASGLFTWRPAVAQADTTNLVTLRVANNATPSLAATQSFNITVKPVNQPSFGSISMTNGQFSLLINGDAGPDYYIQASTNLVDWQNIYTNLDVTLPFLWTDTQGTNLPSRFYRVTLGP